MSLLTPLWLQAVSGDAAITYSAQQDRALLDGLVNAGVLSAGALVVAQRGAGANFSVDVAAGFAAIAGTSVAQQGKYLVQSTAVTNVTIAAAPGSGSRTDLIYAKVNDKQSDGGTLYSWQILAATGVVGGSVPSTPANSLALAQVAVAAGQSSVTNTNITDVRVPSVTYGTPVYAIAVTAVAGLNAPAGAVQIVQEYVTSPSCSAANFAVSFPSSFPHGMTSLLLTSATNSAPVVCNVSYSTSGFTGQAYSATGSPFTGTLSLHYRAVGW